MAETTTDKSTCVNCGSDVRENTQFCYNCGESVVEKTSEPEKGDSNGSPEEIKDEAKSALDDLAFKLKADNSENADALALAAAERKKARVKPGKKKEPEWEAVEPGADRLFILITFLIVVITAAIVFIMVYWK